MKYAEKKYRKRLKRRMVAAIVLLLLVAVLHVATWSTQHNIQYNRYLPGGDGHEHDSPGVVLGHGGLVLVLQQRRDYTLLADDVVLTNDRGWAWTTKFTDRYPYILEPDKSLQFAGFQVGHESVLNRIDGAFQFMRTRWVFGFPLWLVAAPPALLLAIWMRKWRRPFPETATFPVTQVER